ncbi:MAG: hypothetical protein JXR70_09065 [Spirochaetales bacterium]|nr:hypothetical protein [Spirochaetales bacterium]
MITVLPECMFRVFPFALILSTILLFFRELVKPGNRFISFILILTTLFCFLFFGIKLISLIPEGQQKTKNIEYFLVEKEINNFQDYAIYPGKIEGNRLYNLFIYHKNIENPQTRFYNEAITTINQNDLKFSLLRNQKENINIKAQPYGHNYYDEPEDFRYIISSFMYFSDYLKKEIRNFDLYALLLAIAFAMFITGTGLFMRITRWPMFNFIIYFFAMVFIFPCFYFFSTQILPEAGNLIPGPDSKRILPIILFSALGIIFNIIDFIFIPYDRWKKDINHD